jgi:hypothetical protein
MVGATLIVAPISAAQALTAQDCSAVHEAGRSTGPLNGMTLTEFRRTHCGGAASASPAYAPTGEAALTAAPPTATATTHGPTAPRR